MVTIKYIFLIFIILSVFVLVRKNHSNTVILPREQKTVSTFPINDGKDLGYNETNLFAPFNICSAFSQQNNEVPTLDIDSNTPVPYELLDNSSDLEIKLVLNDNGILVYLVNSVPIWMSSNPKHLVHCKETDMLSIYSTKNTYDKWTKIFSKNNLTVYLTPLSVVYKDRIVWSIFNGYDATAIKNQRECVLDSFEKTNGYAVLFSKSRQYKMGVLTNGNIVVLSMKANESKKSTLDTTYKSNLLLDICKVDKK